MPETRMEKFLAESRPEQTGRHGKKPLAAIMAMIAGLAAAFFTASCGPQSDRALIEELMERVGGWAEERDAESILGVLAEDYADFEGRDKASMRTFLQDYFGRFRGIVIHLLATRIDEIKEGRASIRTEMAISSGSAEFFRKLVRFSADNYRFQFQLGKVGADWKFKSAQWEWISLDRLFPESRAVLKKIWPRT